MLRCSGDGEEKLQTIFTFGAAIAEIAGCFAFWAWLRLDKSVLWLIPGIASLLAFGALLRARIRVEERALGLRSQ